MISDFDKSLAIGKIDPFFLGLYDDVLSGWYNKETGELMTGFPVTPDDVVVDVGCGEGGIAKFCAERGAHIVLADVNAAKLEKALDRLKTTPARKLEGHVTDASPLPLADGAATRVLCIEVLEHVDDPVAFMAELVRIGAPGSLYLISVPGTAQEKLQKLLAPPYYFEKPNHIRIFEPEEIAGLIEGAGLEIRHRTQHGFYWTLWWLMFWQTGIPLGETGHASLQAWALTWQEILNGKDGLRIKQALDSVLPKAQVFVARKPD